MFDDVRLVTPKLDLVPEGDVAAIDLPLPPGYGPWVTTLGLGTFCDRLRLYEPAEIATGNLPRRAAAAEHYFWEAGRDWAPPDALASAVFVGESDDGGAIVWLPEAEDLVVLPREDESVYRIPAGLAEAERWLQPDGEPVHGPLPFRYFESVVDRAQRSWYCPRKIPDFATFAARCLTHWGAAEHVVEADETFLVALVPQLHGRLQLATDATRCVGVLLDYDDAFKGAVSDWGKTLGKRGFGVVPR